MSRYKLKYCVVCGHELRRTGAGQQQKYCGAVCSAVAKGRQRTAWTQGLTIKQLRHWYRT